MKALILLLISFKALASQAPRDPMVGDTIAFDHSYKGVKGCERQHAIAHGEIQCKEAMNLSKNAKVKVSLANFQNNMSMDGFFGARYCNYDARMVCQVIWLPTGEEFFHGTWEGFSKQYYWKLSLWKNGSYELYYRTKNPNITAKDKRIFGDIKGNWLYGENYALIEFDSEFLGKGNELKLIPDGRKLLVTWSSQNETFTVE